MRLLADRKSNGLHPGIEAELARLVGISSSAVYGWEKRGSRPRSDIAQRVAAALEVDASWLTDPERPYADKDAGASLATVLTLIPSEERSALAKILADPVERRAWVAAWLARRTRP